MLHSVKIDFVPRFSFSVRTFTHRCPVKSRIGLLLVNHRVMEAIHDQRYKNNSTFNVCSIQFTNLCFVNYTRKVSVDNFISRYSLFSCRGIILEIDYSHDVSSRYCIAFDHIQYRTNVFGQLLSVV